MPESLSAAGLRSPSRADLTLCPDTNVKSGPRGVGKTVLLAYLASHSRESGWVAANVTSRPGMLEDIIERATDAADELVSSAPSVRITSVNVPVLFGRRGSIATRNRATGG